MTSPNRLKALINTLLTYRIKQLSNHYWACSTEAAKFLYGNGFSEYEMIYNAVDVNSFQFDQAVRRKVRTKLDIHDFIAVIHVSNFSPIKNHMFLVDVIQNSPDNIKFIFVGDGSEREKFERALIEKNIIKKCVFLGRRSDINIILQGADLMLLPSLKEGLPVTIVEAQASGLPCILSDTITRDVDVNHISYLQLNTAQWINAISSFSSLKDDERKILSDHFSSSYFNIKNEANRVMNLYLKMLGE